jgi:hypothetical protein
METRSFCALIPVAALFWKNVSPEGQNFKLIHCFKITPIRVRKEGRKEDKHKSDNREEEKE